jgi:hypothetical protein
MRDLLDRIKGFRRKAGEEEVEAMVNDLGKSPSIDLLERVLKHYKKVEQDILSGDLLEWMQENDQLTFETDDFSAKIDTYVSSKVRDDEAAFRWLEENQYGDLIKDTLNFKKGEFTVEAEHLLNELGIDVSDRKRGIHPQSLKKIVSDRLKAGEEIPTEDDGIDVKFFDIVKVKEK